MNVNTLSSRVRSDNSHRQTVKSDGDYRVCFDNSISRFSSKIVFFEIIVESADGGDGDDDLFDDIFGKDDKMRRDIGNYDVAVKDIQGVWGGGGRKATFSLSRN